MVGIAYLLSGSSAWCRISRACSRVDHGTRIVSAVGIILAVSWMNTDTPSSGRFIPKLGGSVCISHSRPRPVQELPTMCGGCRKIPEAVSTDFSHTRSSIGILPILENVLSV